MGNAFPHAQKLVDSVTGSWTSDTFRFRRRLDESSYWQLQWVNQSTGTFSFRIQGRMSEDMPWQNLVIINQGDSGFAVADNVIYKVDTCPFMRITGSATTATVSMWIHD